MQIRIQHQDGREECITLDASESLRFGTRRSADVVLHGAGIFPIHFGILFYRNAFTVAASQQARKILVNGTRVRRAALHDGDRIELGKTVITVVDDEGIQPLEDLSDEVAEPLEDLSDESAGPLDNLSDDLLGAGAPRDDMLAERSVPRTRVRAERSTPPAFVRIVQSVWFARVLLACVLLPLSTLVGIYVGQLPTADERFQAAAEAYRQEDFPRAIENFDGFLARHPQHALADEARMKRDLARLLDRFDRGTDAMTLVNETRVTTEDWQGLQLPLDVQRGLAQILPPLVWDLIRLAQTGAQRGASDAARDARTSAAEGLQMIYKFLPAPLQRDRDVDRLQSALTAMERDTAQAAAVGAASAAIDRAAAAGDPAAANATRQGLLGEYPPAANDSQLLRAMRRVATSDAARATFSVHVGQQASAALPDGQWQARIILAPGAGKAATATEAQAVRVVVPESGTVYGLDAGTGHVLWRRPEEPSTNRVPDPEAPRDYVVADESFVCVMSRDRQEVLSGHYLGHEPGCVWLPPFVVHDYLVVCEQIGPHHTNLHVLRRGDPLQTVQTLLLTGVVSNTPAVQGACVFLPMDGGSVRVLRYRAGDAARPFSDHSDVRLPGRPDPDERVQLAIVQDQLWVAQRGVCVFKLSAADDEPPTLVQRMWEDLQVTQPLHVADDIVVVAGRQAACAGVEVRAWDIQAGKTLWTCNLATPLQTPPFVRAKEGDIWFLSAQGAVYRVPIDQLTKVTEDTTIVSPCGGLVGAAPQGSALRGAAMLCGDVGVMGPTATGDALWVITAQGDASQATRSPLPWPLAAEPAVLGHRLLLLTPDGLLALYDAQRHAVVSSVVLPGVSSPGQRSWQTPAVVGDQECVITDGQSGVFLLGMRADQSGLEIKTEATIDPPLVSRLAAVSNTVWGVDREQRLTALALPGVSRVSAHAMTGALQWGPHVLGAYGYLATDDGKLYCVGAAAEPRWVASLGCAGVVGGCVIDDQHIAIASASGTLWIVHSATGQCPGGPINVREPLDSGPMVVGQRLAVVTKDGCVLVSRETVDAWLRTTDAASDPSPETR